MKFKVVDDSKLKELILHVTKKSENDARFGAVKLNKILFYSDFLAYLKYGKSITGQEYFAIKEGPAPKRMLPVTKAMTVNRELAYREIDVGLPRLKKQPIALRPPNYDKLETKDLAIVDEVIDRLRDKNGKQLSDLSHKFSGYIAAFAEGEKTTIPYSSVRFDLDGFWGIDTPPIPKSLISYGKKLAQKTALAVA